LNQLDGFNLQPRISVPFDGAIDPSTVNSNTVFLVKLPGSGLGEVEFDTFTPHVIGSTRSMGPASLTLFVESNDHLDQGSNYLVVVTSGVHDAAGDPIEVSDDFRQFRRDENFGQTKDRQLKAYRKLLIHALSGDVLESLGLSPGDVVAASVFTTETVTATLESIRSQIKAAPAPSVTFNLAAAARPPCFRAAA